MNQPINSDSGSIITVDPFRCRVWELNDRMQEYITETSCFAEIESFQREGQLVPVVGRLVNDTSDFDIEVICGARRLFVARHLKVSLQVVVRRMTDRQAAAAVQVENSLRKQTSPYERGLWLSRLLKQNVYISQDEMAHELGITPTQVTRLLKFAALPEIVIDAFASPHDILESWAVELHKAWSDERRRLLTERARAIKLRKPYPPAVSVYEMLMASRGSAAHPGRRRAGRFMRGPTGKPLLSLERQLKNVVFRIPNALVDAAVENQLIQAVLSVLTHSVPAENVASQTSSKPTLGKAHVPLKTV